jgi:hypothetical protein
LTIVQAIESLEGEFTKQNVIDWIDEKYPEMGATGRKPTISTLIAKLRTKLNLETVGSPTGSEPHRFRKKGPPVKTEKER